MFFVVVVVVFLIFAKVLGIYCTITQVVLYNHVNFFESFSNISSSYGRHLQLFPMKFDNAKTNNLISNDVCDKNGRFH